MKKILFVLILPFMFNCGGSDTIEIDGLEVMAKDLGKMSWAEANNKCEDLGDGWRLPSKAELNILRINQEKVGCFNDYYWSSTSYDYDNAWGQFFMTGYQFYLLKNNQLRVRAVRTKK